MNGATENQIPLPIVEAVAYLRESGLTKEVIDPKLCKDTVLHRNWYLMTCTVCPRVPANGSFPSRVSLEVFIHPAFPFGEIEVFPPESICYYPHQGPGSRNLCVRADHCAPVDTTRLYKHVAWAKEWLEDAAQDLLLKPTDPYELPPFDAVLRQNAKMMHSAQNRRPKTAVSVRPSVPRSPVRDVIGLFEPLRRLVPALREAGCSFPGERTAGPTCHHLRSAPFVAMVQATDLRDLYDLSTLRPLHDASCGRVLG